VTIDRSPTTSWPSSSSSSSLSFFFFYEWVKSAKRPMALQNNRDTKRQLPTKWKREKPQAKPKCCLFFFSLFILYSFYSLNQRSCRGRYKTNTCNEALERECQRALECCRQLLALSLPHGGPAPGAIWAFLFFTHARARLYMSECCDHTCIHNVSLLLLLWCVQHTMITSDFLIPFSKYSASIWLCFQSGERKKEREEILSYFCMRL
jgi:hypothetical protein